MQGQQLLLVNTVYLKADWAEPFLADFTLDRPFTTGGDGSVNVQAVSTGLAQAATERAETIRRQAWHLYIVVSTIVVASISIWIALLTRPGAS